MITPTQIETSSNDTTPPDTEEKKPELDDQPQEKKKKECTILEPNPDSCVSCEPTPLSEIKLSRKQKKELNRLNALRKLTCAKLALTKCMLDLQDYQRRCWDAERLNTGGDFFSQATEKSIRKIKYSLPDNRDDLKAVLQNRNRTHRLKLGLEHQNIRLGNQKKKKLNSSFTMASMRYDEVESEYRVTNDFYTKSALQNRPERDDPIPGQIFL